MKNKIFTPDEKRKALEIVKQLKSVRLAAIQTGISEPTLYKWRKSSETTGAEFKYPKVNFNYEALREENATLRKVNNLLMQHLK